MPHVHSGGTRIGYELSGEGPPLILLPGMGLDTSIWRRVIRLIEDRFTCVAVDNRGAGESDAPPPPYTINQLAADTLAVARAEGLTRFHLAGHSMGGFVALALAAAHPTRVASLALIGSSWGGAAAALDSTPEAAAAFSNTRGTRAEIDRRILEVCVGEGYLAERPDDFEALVGERLSRPARGRGLAGQRAAGAAFDGRDLLEKISCPRAVIHGTDDKVVSARRASELARGLGCRGPRWVEGGGHLLSWETPDIVVGELSALV